MEELFLDIIGALCKYVGCQIRLLFYRAVGSDKSYRIISHRSYSIFNTLIGIIVIVSIITVMIYFFSK